MSILNNFTIEIVNLSKGYKKQILRDLNIFFFKSEIIGIRGSNGCGKTTFLKMLCGLIEPDSGSIFIDNYEFLKNRSVILEKIGVSLDLPKGTYLRLTVYQFMIYMAGLKGIFGKEARRETDELLNKFELFEYKNSLVQNLSKGMLHRLSLAHAFFLKHQILLLDEPSSYLDKKSLLTLINLIIEFQKLQKTILITSHDDIFLNKICTIQYTLDNEQLILL